MSIFKKNTTTEDVVRKLKEGKEVFLHIKMVSTVEGLDGWFDEMILSDQSDDFKQLNVETNDDHQIQLASFKLNLTKMKENGLLDDSKLLKSPFLEIFEGKFSDEMETELHYHTLKGVIHDGKINECLICKNDKNSWYKDWRRFNY